MKKFAYTAFLALNSLALVVRMLSMPLFYREDIFTWEIYFLLSGGKRWGGQSAFLKYFFSLAIPQVTLIQNNQCATEAYFGWPNLGPDTFIGCLWLLWSFHIRYPITSE